MRRSQLLHRLLDRRAFLRKLAAVPLAAASAGSLLRLQRGDGPSLRRGEGQPAPSTSPVPVPPLSGGQDQELPPPVIGLRTTGGDFVFDPPGLLVEPDTRLVWLNMGDFHTTSSFHPANDDLLGDDQNVPLRIPEDAEPWHSGMLGLDAGSEFETRLTVPGVYDYFCQPHYGFGMVGRLVVGESRQGPGTEPTDPLPEAVRDALPPVSELTGPRGRGWAWASRLNGVLWLRTHDGDAAAAVSAVESGIADDDVLTEHLGSAASRDQLSEALETFAEGVRQEAAWDALVQRADRVKELL